MDDTPRTDDTAPRCPAALDEPDSFNGPVKARCEREPHDDDNHRAGRYEWGRFSFSEQLDDDQADNLCIAATGKSRDELLWEDEQGETS